MRNKLLGIALIAVLLAASLLACAGQNAKPSAGQRGGTLVIGIHQEPDNLNVNIANQTVSFEVNEFINDALLGIDADGEYIPELAKEVPTVQNGGISADGLTVTYHLRDNVKWADGQPCTCDDWKFTWEVITNPNSGVKSTTGWKDLAAVECPAPQTIVFKFAQYYAAHLQSMGGAWILPRHATGDPAKMQEWAYNRAPLGNGPFAFKEWVSGDHLTLVRNEHFYLASEGQPYLDQIIIQIVPSREVGKQLIKTGSIDVLWNLTESDFPDFEKAEGVTLSGLADTRTERLVFNLRNPEIDAPCADQLGAEGLWHWALGDVRVRQAIRYGIDKKLINDKLLYGKATLGTAELNMGWAKPNIPVSAYDPKKAGQLLDEAGWQDANGDGVRECVSCQYAEKGRPLRLKLQTTTGDKLREDAEQVLVALMKEIGVEFYIENIPSAELFGSYSSGAIRKHGQFDILMYTTNYGPDPQSLIENYYASWNIPCDGNKGLGYNYSRWINAEFDRWIKVAGESPDLQTRREAYQKASEEIDKDVPAIYLYDRLKLNARRNTLQGWVDNNWQQIGYNSGAWWLKR